MRVGFAGTPAFAAMILEALLDAGFEVPAVLTQPDRPKGRGLKADPSPVKRLAMDRGLRVFEPATLKGGDVQASLCAIPLDVLAVAAYGRILPPALLGWPRHGAINVHASLLPRWRGAAPIQRAILAGDDETGVTIMQMDAGLDTGAMLDVVRVRLSPHDTTGSVSATLAREGAAALVRVLRDIESGQPRAGMAQPEAGVIHAPKIDKREAAVDWTASASTIERAIRAFDPAPGASTTLHGETVKLWRAESMPASLPGVQPGTIVEASAVGVVVACGEGTLRITDLQPAGSRRMNAAAFVTGRRHLVGGRFEPPCRKPSD